MSCDGTVEIKCNGHKKSGVYHSGHQYRIEEYTYDEGRVVEKKSMHFNRLGDIEKQYVTTYTYAEE